MDVVKACIAVNTDAAQQPICSYIPPTFADAVTASDELVNGGEFVLGPQTGEMQGDYLQHMHAHSMCNVGRLQGILPDTIRTGPLAGNCQP